MEFIDAKRPGRRVSRGRAALHKRRPEALGAVVNPWMPDALRTRIDLAGLASLMAVLLR